MSTSAVSRPFTEGLAQGLIRFQRCERCGAGQRLARYACTACGAESLGWHEATGLGRVFTLAVVMRAPTDAFKARVPYTLALVDLDEGARVMGHADPALKIGDRVRISVFQIDGQPLLRFDTA